MVRRSIDEYGEEAVYSKRRTAETRKRSDHKHLYEKALLHMRSVSESTGKVRDDYGVGKYCTVCGRAVYTMHGGSWVRGEDGYWRPIVPDDYPDLPVVDVEELEGRRGAYRTVQDPGIL